VIYIGIDPDLHHAGIAILDSMKKKPLYLGVARVPRALKGEEANVQMAQSLSRVLYAAMFFPREGVDCKAVVESQRIYPGSAANQNSLLMLAQAAGIAVGILALGAPLIEIDLVAPADWKGQIPKEVHQETLMRHLDWRSPFPFKNTDVKDGERSHVLDAFGLALYGIIRDRLPRDPSSIGLGCRQGKIVSHSQIERLEAQYPWPA
jgi:hypothetical protein